MTKEEARQEIRERLSRETHYVLALAMLDASNEFGRNLLESKIADNEATIQLLGQWLESQGDTWEAFYREHYWSTKK